MQDAVSGIATSAVTQRLAEFVANVRAEDLSPKSMTWASHTLLDWMGVTLAARDEASVRLLIDEVCEDTDETSAKAVALFGHGRRARLLDAALINGTAGHALDYDDVNPLLGGHPSVPTIPVALGLGELLGASGRDVLATIVVGIEVETAIGSMTGTSHYDKGFHNTSTIGAFGAAATAAWLLKLDEAKTRVALGLAASQAAGLKCNFGTMTKPFHAGMAAANGLRAARLAARGFTARADAIETRQGFAATQVPAFDPAAWVSPLHNPGTVESRTFGIEHTLFKYHAACYGAHAALEAAGTLRREQGVSLDEIEAITIFMPARAEGQCDQPEPDSGLAMKFSTQHLAVVALDGVDTAALETYSADVANSPFYVEARRRVSLVFEPERDRYVTDIEARLRDGRVVGAQGNVGIPAADLDGQRQKLAGKFASLATPVIGAENAADAVSEVRSLASASDITRLIRLTSG